MGYLIYIFLGILLVKIIYGAIMEYKYGPFHRIRIVKTRNGMYRVQKQGWFTRSWYSKLRRYGDDDIRITCDGKDYVYEYVNSAETMVKSYLSYLTSKNQSNKLDVIIFRGLDSIKSKSTHLNPDESNLVKELIQSIRDGDEKKETEILKKLDVI